MIRVVAVLVGLPREALAPAQSVSEIALAMEANNSWVIVAPDGRRFFHFDAFVQLWRRVPLLRPLAFVLRLPPFFKWGTRVYKAIAANRDQAADKVAWLRPRAQRWQLSRWGNAVAALAIAYIVMWNLRTIDAQWFRVFPPTFSGPGELLRLDQRWGMFSPFPLLEDGWYVMPATLANGQTVDVFRAGKPVSWSKPQRVAQLYPNERWRKYLMNLWPAAHAAHREPYARWRIRTWNQTHPTAQRIQSLQIYFMQENSLPGGEEALPQRVLLGTYGGGL